MENKGMENGMEEGGMEENGMENKGMEESGNVGQLARGRGWWWQRWPCHSPAVTVSRVCCGFSGDTHLLSPVPRPGRLPRREPLRVRPALRRGRENLLRYGAAPEAGLEGWGRGGDGQQVTICRWPCWGDNWQDSRADPQGSP